VVLIKVRSQPPRRLMQCNAHCPCPQGNWRTVTSSHVGGRCGVRWRTRQGTSRSIPSKPSTNPGIPANSVCSDLFSHRVDETPRVSRATQFQRGPTATSNLGIPCPEDRGKVEQHKSQQHAESRPPVFRTDNAEVLTTLNGKCSHIASRTGPCGQGRTLSHSTRLSQLGVPEATRVSGMPATTP